MKELFSSFKEFRHYLFGSRQMKLFFSANIIIITVSTVLLTLSQLGVTYRYSVGDISSETIKVPWDISYVIEDATAQERDIARNAAALVFDLDSNVVSERLRHSYILFQSLKGLVDSRPGTPLSLTYERLGYLTRNFPEYAGFDKRMIDIIAGSGHIDQIQNTVVRALNDIYENGVLSATYDNPLDIPNTRVALAPSTEENALRMLRVPVSELRTADEIRRGIPSRIAPRIASLSAAEQQAVVTIVRSMIRPNLVFNTQKTMELRDQAAKDVKPVTGLLKKGQIIVRGGDPVTTDIMRKIDIINRHSSTLHSNFVIGILIIQAVFLMLLILFLRESHIRIVADMRLPVLMGVLLLILFVYSYFLYGSIETDYRDITFALSLPIPFVLMLISLLYTVQAAVIAAVYALFFTNVLCGGSDAALIISVCSAFLTIFAAKRIDRRTDFLAVGIILGLVQSLLVIAIGLVEEMPFGAIVSHIRISFAAGIANTIAVMGLFPVFENTFGVLSGFRLLELTDLNAPIFKKMLIKAPGTYNHSIMVANLAEAAAKEIGANHMLVRVGGYYHDIGKIEDAQYYIENRPDGPTRELSPHRYSSLIISHVDKGISMARDEKIPDEIIDFIREHHGQSTMTYFYHQALEEAQKNGSTVDQLDFQYPGPRPRTRETAIVMLADAIEAASRTIGEPTYAKLESLVRKIVQNKLNEGELQNSDLSLRDISRIQKAFIRILAGIFHTRIEYPDKDDIRKLEQSVGAR